MRDRSQGRVRLDRLVRRPVLAEADRVVRPRPDDGQLHQRREPDRRTHVVAEDQERRAVRLDAAAVGGDAVDDRAHRVLADPERDVAPDPAAREEPAADELGVRRLDEVGGAADHRRHGVLERLHDGLAGRARRELFAGLERRAASTSRSARPTPRPTARARPGTPSTRPRTSRPTRVRAARRARSGSCAPPPRRGCRTACRGPSRGRASSRRPPRRRGASRARLPCRPRRARRSRCASAR